MLRPSQSAIEADDERLIILKCLDKREARFSGDSDRRPDSKLRRIEFLGGRWVAESVRMSSS